MGEKTERGERKDSRMLVGSESDPSHDGKWGQRHGSGPPAPGPISVTYGRGGENALAVCVGAYPHTAAGGEPGG